MIEFAHPQLLWLLALLPAIALLRARRGPHAALRFPSAEVARAVARSTRSRAGRWLPYLRLPAAALLVVALARPQVSHASTRVEASGVDIVVALDVSGSMGALDLELEGERADRLQVVKSVVTRFIERRPSDRIGLIAFAGGPYLVSPLTLDHGWLLRNLERVQLGTVDDGTAIGSALAASVNRLRSSDARSKVVILLTDGVNNAGSIQPTLAAETASALGIKVYTIGVGAEGRAPVPVVGEDGERRIVMGEVDVDEETLRTIADETGGTFFRATDTEGLAAIYDRIDELEKTTRHVDTIVRHEEKFAWAAVPALALLAFELLLGATWLRRIP